MTISLWILLILCLLAFIGILALVALIAGHFLIREDERRERENDNLDKRLC